MEVEAAEAEKLAAPPQEPCASDKGWQKEAEASNAVDEAVEPREAETAALQREAWLGCIPCDCYTTLVHSPLLVFACSLSAGYFGVTLAFSLLLQNFGALDEGEDLILVSCSEVFNAERRTCAAEKDVAQAESAADVIHLIALILALLINNKWLKCQCTTLPKTSLCAEVAVCLLTGVMGLAAFIASTAEVSTCFSCKLVPDIQQRFRNQKVDFVSLLSVMRFESFLGVITSLFLLIAVAWMALGRVPWITKLFRGHAY
eukprot:jgi/Chrpa1/17152/Chrysochromulina_OHIO_Genome00019110-RA